MLETIIALLKEHDIHFVTEGSNTKRGEISITCPFCGTDDKSQHMGISPEGYFACWRNKEHSGKNINRLLRALGIETKFNSEHGGSLDDIASGAFFKPEVSNSIIRPIVCLPKQFQVIGNKTSDLKFRQYLISRRFNEKDIDKLILDYQLTRSSLDDFDWKDRIIIASTTNGKVYWTGRSIYPSTLRYKSPKSDVANIKESLLWFDEIKTKKTRYLLVTEGPIDFLKMDFYRPNDEVRATCVFGVNVSDYQLNLLHELETYGIKLLIGFDADAIETALELTSILENALVLPFLVKGYKDYGALSPKLAMETWDKIMMKVKDYD